jgi:hypothetical protein
MPLDDKKWFAEQSPWGIGGDLIIKENLNWVHEVKKVCFIYFGTMCFNGKVFLVSVQLSQKIKLAGNTQLIDDSS